MSDFDIPPVPAIRSSLAIELATLHDELQMHLQRGLSEPADNATPEHRRRCYSERAFLTVFVGRIDNLRAWAETGAPRRRAF